MRPTFPVEKRTFLCIIKRLEERRGRNDEYTGLGRSGIERKLYEKESYSTLSP